MSKKGVQLQALRQAAPELFSSYPKPSRRTFSWKDPKVTHYNETKEFTSAARIEVVDSFKDIPFLELVEEPATLMWEHEGRCQCGKRSYLFSLCPGCLAEEAQLEQEARITVELGDVEDPSKEDDLKEDLQVKESPKAEEVDHEVAVQMTEPSAGRGRVVPALPNVLPYPPVKKRVKTS